MPDFRFIRDPLHRWGVVLYGLFVAGAIYLAFFHWAYDDPFITYRYADNLSRGLGFVYNPGERVLSTTTPLFALLLAGLSHLWPDLPYLATLMGAFSLAVGGLALWRLARTWGAPWAGWAGLLLYPSFSLAVMPLGSETPLYVALCLGALVSYARQRYSLAALLAALATLTRPDGVLVAVVLGLDYLRKSGRMRLLWQRLRGLGGSALTRLVRLEPRRQSPEVPWHVLIIYLCLVLPWLFFAWGYFGSPLPATLAVKQHQGSMAVSQQFAAGFLTILSWHASWPYVLEAALAVAGIVWMAWRARAWALLLAWTVLYFVAYSLLGVSRYFWYYTPLVPGFVAAVGLGLSAFDHQPSVIRERRPTNNLRLSTFNLSTLRQAFVTQNAAQGKLFNLRHLPLALLVLLTLAQSGRLWRLSQNPDARFAIYRAAGEWLAANTPAEATVGALEVGVIGYYAHRPMVDFAGLIQPEVAARLTGNIPYEEAALWAVEHYRPDYLLLFPNLFPRLEQGYVAERCQFILLFRMEANDSPLELAVYACR